MEDPETKNDVANAPPLSKVNIPIREKMIATAVTFLQNPNVRSSPLAQKRAFLQKKGMTEKEIEIAIVRAGANLIPYQNQVAFADANSGHLQQEYRPSFWTQVNRYGSAFIILGVALYGLHRFYKLYIEPILYGQHKRQDRISMMEEQLLELNRTMSHLRKSVTSIEENISIQKNELHRFIDEKSLELEICSCHAAMGTVRTDIATVKSLLLNRKQFPDVPKFSPSIPSWQMIGDSDKKSEREVELVSERLEESEATTNGHDPETRIEVCNDSEQEEPTDLLECSMIPLENGEEGDVLKLQ